MDFSTVYFIGKRVSWTHLQFDTMITINDGHRQFLYSAPVPGAKEVPKPLVRTVIPAGPNDPRSIEIAIVLFYPDPFRQCPSFDKVVAGLKSDFVDLDAQMNVPDGLDALMEEALPLFETLHIAKASLEPVNTIGPGKA